MTSRQASPLKAYVLMSALAATFMFAMCSLMPAKAHEKHPGRADRVKQCTARGDARTTLSVAGHTTSFAIRRYRLENLVTKSEIENAQEQVYEFLKWKLGNPSAVCAQYISAGYGHFEKAYADEAGAALIGFELPKEKGGHSELYLPPALLKLGLTVEKGAIGPATKAIEAAYGIPPSVSKPLLEWYLEKKYQLLGRLGINFPKNYDFPNDQLEATIKLAMDAKRDAKGTALKLQRVIDRASAGGPQKPPTLPVKPVKKTF